MSSEEKKYDTINEAIGKLNNVDPMDGETLVRMLAEQYRVKLTSEMTAVVADDGKKEIRSPQTRGAQFGPYLAKAVENEPQSLEGILEFLRQIGIHGLSSEDKKAMKQIDAGYKKSLNKTFRRWPDEKWGLKKYPIASPTLKSVGSP